ncbi:MAG: ribosome small subunit-dependent GTPase A [Denitrovibrio sp.]|nr:MAG: ribosome small subunit-dependent GTPase A [Denitrovibrio sp.]
MNLSKGRVIFASINSYTVLSENGEEYYSVLSGSFSRDNRGLPAVGDLVRFKKNENGDSVIDQIIPRKSVISRKSAGNIYSENVLAANIDIMLILTALDETFSVRRIERFLVLAKSGGVTPVILLSKADKCDPISLAIHLTEAEEVAGDAQVIEFSSITGTGVDKIEELLKEGVTACAVGLSGAGKSTLLNRLSGDELQSVKHVREFDSKGRHTTTSRQMFKLPMGAMFVDTPGIREVGLKGDTEAVEEVFDEIISFAEDCFFSDCTHVHEPSCAVIKAVENGEISRERYDSYIKLRRESENYKMRTETPQEQKRSDKKLARLIKTENKRKKKF